MISLSNLKRTLAQLHVAEKRWLDEDGTQINITYVSDRTVGLDDGRQEGSQRPSDEDFGADG